MTDIDISPSALPWETWLQPDSHVMCSHMTSEPRALLQSLARADLPPGLSVELGVPFSMDAHAFPETVTLHVMGGMGTAAALGKKRPLHIDRKEYPAFPEDYASGKCNADIVLISLAQAAVGSLHLGASQGAAVDAARRARVVIAEINTAAPVVSGASWPDDIAITPYPMVHVCRSASGPYRKRFYPRCEGIVIWVFTPVCLVMHSIS